MKLVYSFMSAPKKSLKSSKLLEQIGMLLGLFMKIERKALEQSRFFLDDSNTIFRKEKD